MFDINKHRFFLVKILKDIYSDPLLSVSLGFKGGTSLMFFYDLPRFSTDLDFDLLKADNQSEVFKKIRKIVLKYGKIHDEAQKFFGLLIVLDYGSGERKLKIEISSRLFENRYEIKNLLGFNVKVMTKPDLFAHKLCALLDRPVIANRDIFDSWFFMHNQTPLNRHIVEQRMKLPLAEYINKCIASLSQAKNRKLLDGLGELLDVEMKKFVKIKLLEETIELLEFYKKYPILDD
jgi:predicted nucleotidyltransferase component of viral defense system